MKKPFLISLLSCFFLIPAVAQEGPKNSFIPENWKVIMEASGDLNKDTVEDVAMIIEYAGDALEGERPRSLLVLFKKKASQLYTLACRADHVILDGQSGGMMGDPLEKMEIKRNVLRIDFFGGSSDKWSTTHRYYFKNKFFNVIGATYKDEPNTGGSTTYDYNLSTGDMIITTNGKATKKVIKIMPVDLTDFEPDAVWALMMNDFYGLKKTTCMFTGVSAGDCAHIEFDCGDFGNAETYLDQASRNLWDDLRKNDAKGAALKGKSFEIKYIEKTGTKCEAEGEAPYQLVTGFALKN